MRGAASITFTDTFKRDFLRLSPDVQRLTECCLRDIQQDPIPGARRAHNVTPSGHKPTIYTVDVTPNKAYKMSFQMDGNVATLRRVGTHKAIAEFSAHKLAPYLKYLQANHLFHWHQYRFAYMIAA